MPLSPNNGMGRLQQDAKPEDLPIPIKQHSTLSGEKHEGRILHIPILLFVAFQGTPVSIMYA